jgi:oligosaccharide translocation protein RFT1
MNTTILLILFQLIIKIMSLLTNTLLLRYTTPDFFSYTTLYWDFIITSILFLSNDGFRGALLRYKEASNKFHQFYTIAILPLPYLFLLLAIAYRLLPPPDFTLGILLVLSVLVQFFTEPFIILFQILQFTKLRFWIDTGTTLARHLLLLCLVYLMPPPINALNLFKFYAVIQVFADSMAYCLYWYFASRLSYSPCIPTSSKLASCYKILLFGTSTESSSTYLNAFQAPIEDSYHADADVIDTLRLGRTLTLSNIAQHCLNQGDLLLLNLVQPKTDFYKESLSDLSFAKGLFAISNNYAALIPRILLQPIEESIFLFYSTDFQKSTKTSHKNSQNSLVFEIWFKAELYFCLFLVSFGPPLIPYAILMLHSQNLEMTHHLTILFKSWCVYIPFIAINGILDAYLTAVTPEIDLASYQKKLTFLTVFLSLGTAFPIFNFRFQIFEFFGDWLNFSISKTLILPCCVLLVNMFNTCCRLALHWHRPKFPRLPQLPMCIWALFSLVFPLTTLGFEALLSLPNLSHIISCGCLTFIMCLLLDWHFFQDFFSFLSK